MVEKNQKKEQAKTNRNLWPFKPVTRIENSPKLYNRARDRKRKDLYNYEEEDVSCDTDKEEPNVL